MPRTSSDKFRALLSHENWDQLVPVLLRLDPSVAADSFSEITSEQQGKLYRRFPIEFAARLAEILPYYDAWVLLHTRTDRDLAAIVDGMNPAERLRFVDELPEQQWQTLMDELARAQPAGDKSAASSELRSTELIIEAPEFRPRGSPRTP